MLHPKWKEAVSKQDLDLFHNLIESKEVEYCPEKRCFVSAKATLNYRKDILATVLIVNNLDDIFVVDDLQLDYMENNLPVASNTFKIPTLIIEPKTITPWTFIFPANTVLSAPHFTNWHVRYNK